MDFNKYLGYGAIALVVIVAAVTLSAREVNFSGVTNLTGLGVGADGLSVTGATTLTATTTLGKVQADGQIVRSAVNATSTAGSLTVVQGDIYGYDTLLVTPGASLTFTLPASSTLTSLIPNTGEWIDITFVNADASGSDVITIAGNTGVTLQQASSTLAVAPLQIGILRLIRLASTDIVGFFTQGY